MSYTICNVIDLGSIYTGVTLNAQLCNSSNGAVGSAIASGFYERPGGLGIYAFRLLIPDGHVGWCDIYVEGAPATILATLPINPAELENADVKTSSFAGDILIFNIWNYARRLLTMTSSQIQDALVGSRLTIYKSVTFVATLPDLAIPATWTKVYFTVKRKNDLLDAAATLQMVVSNPPDDADGLITINGAANSSDWGTLIVTQAAGTVDIKIADDATVLLGTDEYVYDVKAIDGDSDSYLLTNNTCIVILTTTRAIS